MQTKPRDLGREFEIPFSAGYNFSSPLSQLVLGDDSFTILYSMILPIPYMFVPEELAKDPSTRPDASNELNGLEFVIAIVSDCPQPLVDPQNRR